MATLSVRSTVKDGHVVRSGFETVYLDCHGINAASGISHAEELYVGQQFPIATIYYAIWRIVLYFDTSGIPPSAVIESAVLTFKAGTHNWSNTNFLITLVDGSVAEDPLSIYDYGDLLSKVTSGGNQINTADGWVAGSTKTITLDATGRSWISKTGYTKLALRSSRDISATAPFQVERVDIVSGADSDEEDRPLLEIVYRPGGVAGLQPGALLGAMLD